MSIGDERFDIETDRGFVASARSSCRRCARGIDVVCLYCQDGRVGDECVGPLRVQQLWAVDQALARQLCRWPGYRWNGPRGRYLNHCAYCGVDQDEDALHDEPGQPFYDLGREVPAGVTLQALAGRLRMGGDCVMDL